MAKSGRWQPFNARPDYATRSSSSAGGHTSARLSIFALRELPQCCFTG